MIKPILKVSLRIYKAAISPILPPCCRFYPSCSDYAYEAIDTHGVLRGLALSTKRLARCHPLSSGGIDPVPGEAGKIL